MTRILAALLFSALAATTSAARAEPQPAVGMIAFTHFTRSGSIELFAIRPDGRAQHPLLRDRSAGDAAWSRDGRRLAFASTTRDQSRQGLMVADADGTNVREVTVNRLKNGLGVQDSTPSWSPDGRRLVFVHADPFGTGGRIEVVDLQSGNRRRLISGRVFNPVWSPNGSKIAFVLRKPRVRTDIYVMNPDGSGVARLTTSPADDLTPDWSPDGQRIAFTSRRDGDFELYVMNWSGSAQRRVTFLKVDDYGPSWSGDGKRLAFASKRVRGQFDIYVTDANGRNQKRVTTNRDHDTDAAWQPSAGRG